MDACTKCGSCSGVAPQWTLFVHLQPPSQNEHISLHGAGYWKFAKERARWVHLIRQAMLDTGGGRFEPVPQATGKRRIVFTRLYSGKQQARDYGNLVGGMKLVVDALRMPRLRKITSGKSKGKVITVEGAGLIIDDSPDLLDDVYLQVRTDGRSGLRMEISDIGPPLPGVIRHVQLDLSSASATIGPEEATVSP